MSIFFRYPAAKIVGAFLGGMLLVLAVLFSGSIPGLPRLSWAEQLGTAVVQAGELPGIGANTIPDMVDRVGPAVVRINTTSTRGGGGQTDPLLNDPFFRHFFGGSSRTPSQPQTSSGLGSGFIVSPDGYILTNEHVISGADSIEVTLAGREKPYPARKIGVDRELDLAVLKIDAAGDLPTVPLGNSDQVRVGDWVVAIGNPYGLDHTVTAGVISAKSRPISVEDRQYRNLLQTDASINPGNSGGPLLNLGGEVVGINTAINIEAQGIGFAIPSSTVKSVFDELVQKGEVSHPWLGVYLQPLTGEAAQENQGGAVVASLVQGGPAEKAGLRQGDVLVSYNGSAITSPGDLVDLVSGTQVGSQVEVRFVRDGQTQARTVTIEAKKT